MLPILSYQPSWCAYLIPGQEDLMQTINFDTRRKKSLPHPFGSRYYWLVCLMLTAANASDKKNKIVIGRGGDNTS